MGCTQGKAIEKALCRKYKAYSSFCFYLKENVGLFSFQMTEKESPQTIDQAKIILPFKAIIFDMDGTLLESTEADYRAWERTYKVYGKVLTYDNYTPLLGIRSADVIRNYLGFTDEEDVKRILQEKFDHFVDHVNEHPVVPVPGAIAFLKNLSKYAIKVGLATSSRQAKTMLLLKRLDLFSYFDAIVTGEQVNNGKPSPEIFLKAAEKLNTQPIDCVVVEDGPIGVTAAKGAGMKCIAISTTHPPEKLGQADCTIVGYENVNFPELLSKLLM